MRQQQQTQIISRQPLLSSFKSMNLIGSPLIYYVAKKIRNPSFLWRYNQRDAYLFTFAHRKRGRVVRLFGILVQNLQFYGFFIKPKWGIVFRVHGKSKERKVVFYHRISSPLRFSLLFCTHFCTRQSVNERKLKIFNNNTTIPSVLEWIVNRSQPNSPFLFENEGK